MQDHHHQTKFHLSTACAVLEAMTSWAQQSSHPYFTIINMSARVFRGAHTDLAQSGLESRHLVIIIVVDNMSAVKIGCN